MPGIERGSAPTPQQLEQIQLDAVGNLAVLAAHHKIPFYIAAPTTTIDLNTPNGDAIEIEERPAAEVTHVGGEQVTPDGVAVGNPAFDVTPARYITAIITERGVVYPPFEENLRKLLADRA